MDIIKKIIGTIKSRDKPNDNISDNRHRYITGILSMLIVILLNKLSHI